MRRRTIQLASGDVSKLAVIDRGGRVLLAVYQSGGTKPLIHAVLSDQERQALARALLEQPNP